MRRMIPDIDNENLQLRQANAQARMSLDIAARRLCGTLKDESIMTETPLEVEAAMKSVLKEVNEAILQLRSVSHPSELSASPLPGGPTRQQGQFLAFISEYMTRNAAGMAPSHAEMQRFFNLTPPSVNSMLIRLEQRGFIRRIPGKARAIEIAVSATLIPPLDRPFKG